MIPVKSLTPATLEWNVSDYAPPQLGKLLLDGIETTNPGARFAAYSRILRELSGDVR
jgi:hypothetical protein